MRTVCLTLLLASAVSLASCHRVQQKAHEAITATGETVGKGGAEFVEGVSKGIDQTAGHVDLSDDLAAAGLSFGKFKVDSGDSSDHKNRLTIYFIFDKDIDRTITVKIFDSKNDEYARTSLPLSGKAGTARNVEIRFDAQTDIESHSRFVVQ